VDPILGKVKGNLQTPTYGVPYPMMALDLAIAAPHNREYDGDPLPGRARAGTDHNLDSFKTAKGVSV
jgi:hypothetical protein